jgi:hypothetical protein
MMHDAKALVQALQQRIKDKRTVWNLKWFRPPVAVDAAINGLLACNPVLLGLLGARFVARHGASARRRLERAASAAGRNAQGDNNKDTGKAKGGAHDETKAPVMAAAP